MKALFADTFYWIAITDPNDTAHQDALRMTAERAAAPLLTTDEVLVALGQTRAGRYLRVIYVPDPEAGSVFVITAYELGPKALKALRRRRRRKA